MLMKGRSDKMRHVPRTHRINLDWLLCQMRVDPGLRTKHISTKDQLADLFTKGIFAVPQWNHLLRLSGIVPSKQQTVQLLGQPNQKKQLGQQLGQQKATVEATQPNSIKCVVSAGAVSLNRENYPTHEMRGSCTFPFRSLSPEDQITEKKAKRSGWDFSAGFWRSRCATRLRTEQEVHS